MAKSLMLLAILALAQAQQTRVDPGNTYHRIICIVPLVGSGTATDPLRPQYAPWPPSASSAPTAIISFSHQVSDDGRFALVEFVARDRAAFEHILKDKSVKVFEKGKDKKDDIEKELKKLKQSFNLDKIGAVRP